MFIIYHHCFKYRFYQFDFPFHIRRTCNSIFLVAWKMINLPQNAIVVIGIIPNVLRLERMLACSRYKYKLPSGYGKCVNRYGKLTKSIHTGWKRHGLLSTIKKKCLFPTHLLFFHVLSHRQIFFIIPPILFFNVAFHIKELNFTFAFKYYNIKYSRGYYFRKIHWVFSL